ncbi:MAG TPA: hypothetical protein VKT49_20790 [Bryobacteraceae bacterium]|nr:hypothetical protein [Bryobacteraceae bacterium]
MVRRFSPGFLGVLVSLIILPVSAVSASAQQQTSSESARDCARIAETYVTERLSVWQQRLKLQDWKISIVMAHPTDLKPKTLGNIHWDADKKSAVIRVLDASDYRLACRDMLDDMEFTVVHELIHLELSSLPRSEASRRDEEYAVNQIADALLALDRHR